MERVLTIGWPAFGQSYGQGAGNGTIVSKWDTRKVRLVYNVWGEETERSRIDLVNGRSPTALNALKHGLRENRALDEERNSYETALRSFQVEYSPQTGIEEILTRRLARLDRAGELERRGFAQCFSGPPGRNGGPCCLRQGARARGRNGALRGHREGLPGQRARKGREARILMSPGLLTKQAL